MIKAIVDKTKRPYHAIIHRQNGIFRWFDSEISIWAHYRASKKNKSPILLVFWPVFRVAQKAEYNEYASFHAP